jgi:tRNA(fMet)-specific endonuclease VapC
VTKPIALLDTNTCIYLIKALSEIARQRVERFEAGSVVTSAIAYAEVMRGIHPNDQRAVADSATLFRQIPVLPFGEQAAHAYKSISFRLGGFDRLIAAHALSLGLVLVTNNVRDFEQIPGLRVEDWTRP